MIDRWITRAGWVVLGALGAFYVYVLVCHDRNRKRRERLTWGAAGAED
jgi:hypothetical protein